MVAKGSFTLSFADATGGQTLPVMSSGNATLYYFSTNSLADTKTFIFPSSNTQGNANPASINIAEIAPPLLEGIYTVEWRTGTNNNTTQVTRLR